MSHNGCGGLKRAFTMNEKNGGWKKSDERRVIKGKRTEAEDYLTSVRRESASYLIMDKQTPRTVWSDIIVPENQ